MITIPYCEIKPLPKSSPSLYKYVTLKAKQQAIKTELAILKLMKTTPLEEIIIEVNGCDVPKVHKRTI